MNKTERYRETNGKVYEWDSKAKAYIFVGYLNGAKLKEWITDYEDYLMYVDDDDRL